MAFSTIKNRLRRFVYKCNFYLSFFYTLYRLWSETLRVIGNGTGRGTQGFTVPVHWNVLPQISRRQGHFANNCSFTRLVFSFAKMFLHLLIILIPEYVYHFFFILENKGKYSKSDLKKKKKLIEVDLVNEFYNVLNRFLHGMHCFILFLSEVLFSLMKLCYINVQYVKIKFTSILTL